MCKHSLISKAAQVIINGQIVPESSVEIYRYKVL